MTEIDDELTMIETINQMLPYVFIGSWDQSTDMNVIKSKNIKHILNLSIDKKDNLTMQSMEKLKITHNHIPIDSNPVWIPNNESKEFISAMNGVFCIIANAINSKQNILIHDNQSINISPAAICYYLLKLYYDKAKNSDKNIFSTILNDLKKKRKCIDINFGVLEKLEDFEANLSGRPVILSQSLSIRRNVILKKTEKMRFLENVAQEKKLANERVHIVSRTKLI